MVLYSNIPEWDNLDVGFIGSFVEFVYLRLACVAGSCNLSWAVMRSFSGAILLSESRFVFQSYIEVLFKIGMLLSEIKEAKGTINCHF